MEDKEETQRQELFPDNIRRIGYATSLLMFALCCIYLYCYSQRPDEYTLIPSMLGVNNLIVLSAFTFLFFKVRWAKIGVKVSKLGPMEFSHIIDGQSKKHSKDIAAIEERLKELESALVAAPATTAKNGFELELERKIIEF
jgi:hypothetical protein